MCLCLLQKNIQLAQYLVEKGSPIFPSLKQEENDMPDTLLHHVAETLLQVQSGDPNSVIIFLTKTVRTTSSSSSALLYIHRDHKDY